MRRYKPCAVAVKPCDKDGSLPWRLYGARTPARRSSSLSRDLNLSLQSQCSSYQPNEGLTQRGDLQVQFTDDDLQTPFDSFTSSGSGAISTPEVDRRSRYHPAAGHTQRSLPLSPSQPTIPATLMLLECCKNSKVFSKNFVNSKR